MHRNVTSYFERTIIPLITREFPEVAAEMIVQVHGSVALGRADDLSDLDANIWLDDPLWDEYASEVQALLDRSVEQIMPYADADGHEICVRALSWLGAQGEFLRTDGELPWDRVDLDQLHWIETSLILRDPHGMWRRIREASAPDRYPERLWNKLLISKSEEVRQDLDSLCQVVKRGQATEAGIFFGSLLENLLHIGFILHREYSPWRKHLRWAFDKLPVASELAAHIEAASNSLDWDERISSLQAAVAGYADYARRNDMVSPDVLESLWWMRTIEDKENPA